MQEALVRHAADDFDDPAEGVDAGVAVAPLAARLEVERLLRLNGGAFRERAVPRGVDVRDADRVAAGQPRSVREQVFQRDWPRRLLQRQRVFVARGDEPLPFELGQVLFDRVFHGKFPALGEHHDGDGRNRLGHRRDAEERAGFHRIAAFDVALADDFEGIDARGAATQGDRAGEFAGIDEGLHLRAEDVVRRSLPERGGGDKEEGG